MDESKLALKQELGQLFGQPYRDRPLGVGSPEEALITLERETVVRCGHCMAWVRLMGIPPEVFPEEPKIMLYYPVQFCPQCGNEVGRALDIELFPFPGGEVWHGITCPQCGSGLRYMTQALAPQYLEEVHCPICEASLRVEGLRVEVLEAVPWPPVALEEEPEKPYRAIQMVGGGLAILLTGVAIGHLMTKKSRR